MNTAVRVITLSTLLSAVAAAGVPVGVEATLQADLPAGVRAAPVGAQATVGVRIGDTQVTPSPGRYMLHYQLFAPGQHDLRQSLLTDDGGVLTNEPPLTVTADSTLPTDDDGAIDHPALPLPTFGGYARVRRTAVIVWAGVGAFALLWPLRERLRQPSEAVPPLADSPPTEDRRLSELADLARAGRLDTPGKLRIELLLLSRWRKEAAADTASLYEAMPMLRRDAAVGPLLAALDNALHAGPSRSDPNGLVDVLDRIRSDASDTQKVSA